MTVTAARAAAVVRAGVGVTMLLRPDMVARVTGAPVQGTHPVLRVLGLRHVVQAVALLAAPTPTVVRAGAAVDATHVTSCLAFACLPGPKRTAVLREAALETGILTGTWVTRPRA